MSPISFFKVHPRADFSAFLDGELAAAATARLEAHLPTCHACTAELEALRAVRVAMRELPEAPPPRSFAITPEMARDARPARRPPAHRPLQPLVNGLRLTSAGLATALAVVVVVAVAGGGSDSRSGGDSLTARMESTDAEYAGAPTQTLAHDADRAATSAPVPTEPLFTPFPDIGGAPHATPDAGSGGTGGVGGAGDGTGGNGGAGGGSAPGFGGVGSEDPPPVTIAPDEGAGTIATSVPESGATTDKDIYPTEQPLSAWGDGTAGNGEAEIARENLAPGDGGADTLTIAAIVLGLLLGVALIGSIAASRLAQKTH